MKTNTVKQVRGPIVIALIILVSGCVNKNVMESNTTDNPEANKVSGNPEANAENLRVAVIELPGMFCPACAKSSVSAFKRMGGVVDAKVDIKSKSGTVIYNASIISKEQLVNNGVIQAYDGRILSDREYSP